MMLDYIIGLDRHFTLQELLVDFTAQCFVSAVSVRRNMELFLQAGLVVMYAFPQVGVQYELAQRAETHYHRVCIHCGSIMEFTDARANKYISGHRFRNFSKLSNQVVIYGLCKQCRNEEARLKKLNQNLNKQ